MGWMENYMLDARRHVLFMVPLMTLGLAGLFEGCRMAKPRRWMGIPAAALLSGVAVLCQFPAYQKLLVAYVETIKRAGGLLSVVLGGWVFRESGLATRLPAALLILLGILLILFS